MSAALEFHWPGTTRTTPSAALPAAGPAPPHPPPRTSSAVDAVLSKLLEARPAQLVALADKAECELRLRGALARVGELERALAMARAELDDTRSIVEAQRLHIAALDTQLRSVRESAAVPGLRGRLLPALERAAVVLP